MTDETPAFIHDLLSLPKFGSGICFRRMEVLLRPLMQSDWGQQFNTIRVTGSNGKGSVTAMLHSILQSLGITAGRYTSPHLERFNERIVIGSQEASDNEIERAVQWIRQQISENQSDLRCETFGSFELITAIAIRCFSEANVKTAILEAGIGGRFDPVRLFPGTLVALTSIDLEHTELLGKTKEQIAFDKIDLCPDHGTVVSVNRDQELWARMAAYCRLRHISLVDANSVWTVQRLDDDLRVAAPGMKVRLTRNAMSADVTMPLPGLFQLDNAAVACTIAELWAQQFLAETAPKRVFSAVCDGLSTVTWPGRFQNISSAPPVYIDVGHSPDACRRFVESVGIFLKGAPILLVTGVSHNKAVEDILSILVPIATTVVCTRAYHMGEKVERISEVVQTIAPQIEQHQAATMEEAVSLAREIADRRGMTVIVAGGLFLSIEFLTAWRGSDPRRLRFY